MAFIICEPCVDVKDTACVEVCPVDCIYDFDGENQLYIHPTECIDCAACEPECPVEAIFIEADVPSQWQSYIELNVTIFDKHPTAEATRESADAESGSDAGVAANPVAASSEELNALRRLLADVGTKTVSLDDAVEQVLPLLEKLGVDVSDD
jgi:NAD-dependent dihydropyrimidine dehydrogenase PreA subunit